MPQQYCGKSVPERYLKNRSDKQSRQIVFDGEPLTMKAVWLLGDRYFPRGRRSSSAQKSSHFLFTLGFTFAVCWVIHRRNGRNFDYFVEKSHVAINSIPALKLR